MKPRRQFVPIESQRRLLAVQTSNMRFSQQLLDAVKFKAAARGMSYQRFIRQVLEAAIRGR